MKISDLILELHRQCRDIKDPELTLEMKILVNDFAILGNKIYESETKDNFPLV
jgi:hypothetical protein